MEANRHRDLRNQRSGSSGARDSDTASHVRASEDRDMLADAREEAADQREAAADNRELDQDARQRDQDQRERDQDQRDLDHVADQAGSITHLEILTDRQREILVMIADGMSNKAIAKQLFISINTLKTIIGAIYEKIDATSRTQAVHWYTHGPRDSA